jgi:hypothetical protein
MANPPPPYSDITGISRTVMKDNAQESITNYNGNARPGEMVVDLTNNNIYIGNTNGNLTLINTGGGSGNAEPAGSVGAVQINAGGNLFGASANLTFLNNVLSVVGNVTGGNIISNTIVNDRSGNVFVTGNLLPSAVNYTLGTLDVPWGNAFFGPQSVTILDSTGNIGNTVTIENISANITLGTAGFNIVKLGTADSIFRIEALTGQIFSFANTIIENDTNATDIASGSLQTLGGAAIAQDLYVGSNIYSNGVTVGGSVLVQDGSQNNIIELQTDGNIVFNGGSTLNLNGGFHVSSVSTNSGDANIVNYTGGAFVYGPALKDYAGNIGANNVTITGVLKAPQTTKASTATGTTGQICWDANYIYVCTATNTWKRSPLTGGY